MKKKELIKRYIFAILGLFIAALGVAVTKKSGLGVSPISSISNVLSIKFDFMSIGNWLIIWNILLIIGQIIILRKNFKLFQLLQIPFSFLFGYFTDFWMIILKNINFNYYIINLLLVFIGTFILSFGICVSISANIIMNSGEAFVKAISDTLKKEFGNIKIIFDILCVTSAVILSIIFFNFKLVGIREGTIIAAIITGLFVKINIKLFKNNITSFLKK